MATDTDHPFLDDAAQGLLPEAAEPSSRPGRFRTLDWRQAAGGGAVLLGFLALALGWWGVSGTGQTADQLSYVLSGGLTGAAFVATGLTLFMAYEHAADRDTIAGLETRLRRLEEGLAGEFDAVHSHLDQRPVAAGGGDSERTRQPAAWS